MIKYDLYSQAALRYRTLLKQIVTRSHVRRVCDVGGGARPSLSPDLALTHCEEYHLLDISAQELAKAPECYEKIQANICADELPVSKTYDLVISRFVAEHVCDGRRFHKNILDLLSNDGYALHVFPTLFSLPFLINCLTPEKLATALLDFFSPQARSNRSKFPAYYSWCRGPTNKQVRRLQALGYEIVEYSGFFGTPYLNKLGPLKKIDRWLTDKLLDYPVPSLTSYACLLLRKKSNQPRPASYPPEWVVESVTQNDSHKTLQPSR